MKLFAITVLLQLSSARGYYSFSGVLGAGIKGGFYLRAGSILQLFKIVQKVTKNSLILGKNAIFHVFS